MQEGKQFLKNHHFETRLKIIDVSFMLMDSMNIIIIITKPIHSLYKEKTKPLPHLQGCGVNGPILKLGVK